MPLRLRQRLTDLSPLHLHSCDACAHVAHTCAALAALTDRPDAELLQQLLEGLDLTFHEHPVFAPALAHALQAALEPVSEVWPAWGFEAATAMVVTALKPLKPRQWLNGLLKQLLEGPGRIASLWPTRLAC